MKSDRIATIDVMKGIGIILVVLYHAINYGVPNYNGLYYAISSFFMAMFFIISGYLVYGKISNTQWVKDKLIKLLIPIMTFTIIYWIAGYFSGKSISLSDFAITGIFYGFSGLVTWYLWCLILCYIITWGLAHIPRISLIISALIAVIALTFIPFEIFGFLLFKWYVIYFLVGYLIKHYNIKIGKWIYLSLVLFPVCLYAFKWMIPYQNVEYAQTGFVSVTRTISAGQPLIIPIYLLMAFLGTAFVYSVTRLTEHYNRIIIYLGKVSLGIYLLHIIFIRVSSNCILDTVIAMGISIAIYELAKRWKPTNKILFGK